MTEGLLLLGLLGLTPRAPAQDAFLDNMRKADSRTEPEERIEYFSRAIRAWRPSHSRALLGHCHLGRGSAFFDQDDPASAVADLDKAVAADPGAPKAFLLRGRLRLRQGKFRLAAEDLSEFISLEPEEVEGPLALGRAREFQGDWSRAQAAFEQAASLAPRDPRPLAGLARLRAARRRWEEALSFLNRADAAAQGRDGEILVERGRVQAAAGRAALALEDFEKGIGLGENRLADLQRAGAAPVVVHEFQEELALAYLSRGEVLEGQGRLAPALADFEEACRLGAAAGCRKSKIVAQRLRVAPEPPEPKPARAPKKPRRSRVLTEPGERIYAN